MSDSLVFSGSEWSWGSHRDETVAVEVDVCVARLLGLGFVIHAPGIDADRDKSDAEIARIALREWEDAKATATDEAFAEASGDLHEVLEARSLFEAEVRRAGERDGKTIGRILTSHEGT